MKYYFGILSVVLLLISCTSEKITVKKFPNYLEIQSGDSVWISWEFANANYVRVAGFENNFKPYDSLLLKPISSMRLDVVAFGDKDKQITQSVYIVVIPKENQSLEPKKSIQRGPRLIEDIFSIKNSQPSDFFCGFSDGSISNVKHLKVFRAKSNSNSDSLEIAFALLDVNGNLCYQITKYSSDIKAKIEQKCKNKFSTDEYFSLSNSFKTLDGVDFHFLIDYAILLETPKLKEQILDAVKFLDPKDRASLSFFGVELSNAIPLERSDKFFWDLETIALPKRNELSSVYRSLWFLLDNIESEGNSTVVLITNRMDNSSINYTLDDVILKARTKNVSICAVTFGNEVSPSTYRFLTAKTGGNFYHFPWKSEDLSQGLVETILSNKYFYSTKFKLNEKASSCNDLDLKLSVFFGNLNFYDYYSYPIRERTFYTNYQAVSLFGHSDTTIKDVFLPSIMNLANLLISHRSLTLELIGTAGIGESDYNPIQLSTDRALAVQKRLIALGVFPSQVRAKGIGISKPIYSTEDDEISGLFNRRVEIRWILPEVLPYTIVVDTVASEEQAEKKVEFWEKKGFRAFYDRLYYNNQILYKVVLWGYRTYDEAEREAKRISRKYRKAAFVE